MRKQIPAPDDRIAKLSQRFKTHAVGRRPQATPRTRERHSLYLDSDLVLQADKAYRDISHELYPQTVSKSLFWETLLGYGLAHLDDIKRAVSESTVAADSSAD